MLDDNAGAEVFVHSNNITIGQGRVLWAQATTDTSGNPHAAGWVLPGGRRTQDEAAARFAAHQIDQFDQLSMCG